MAAHSHAASLAQIDLTVEGPESCTLVTYSQRQITLTAANNVVTIGRASKVSAKGFVPAENNAWFDSAVMSRDHAEISVDMDEKKVQVRDKGSLHGTYLNEREKLEKDPRELKNGDRLTFGLPVDRGTSRFMPVSVKVGVSFNDPANRCVPSSFVSSALTETLSVGDDCGTSTFQVPDDSEGSSDIDGYTSDSSIYSSHSAAMNPQTASTSSPSFPPRPVPGVEVIDLTGAPASNQKHTWTRMTNRAYENSTPTFIDLSSPPSSPLMFRDSRDAKYAPYGAPVTNGVEVSQLDIPNVSAPARRVPIQDISSLGAATSRSAELASALGQTAHALVAVEPNVLDSDMDSNYSSDDSINSQNHDNDSELSDAESNIGYPEDPVDSDSSSDDDNDSDSDHDMDDQSDRSSALNEDLESLANYSDDDNSVSEDQGVVADINMFDFTHPASPLLLSPFMDRPASVQDCATLPVVSDEQDNTLNYTASDTTSPVLPVTAKKDETVAKSTSPIAIEKLLNDRPGMARSTIIHPLPELRKDAQPNSWSIVPEGDFESLGVKTGKVDFFAAREENKAYFNKVFGQTFNKAALDTQTTSRPASSVYALCNEPIAPRFETEQSRRDTSRLDLEVFSKLPPLSQEAPFRNTATQSISFDSLDRLLSSHIHAESESNAVQEEVRTKRPETENSVAQSTETRTFETGKPEAQEVNVQNTIQKADEPQPLVQVEKPKSNLIKRKRKAEDMSVETVDDLKWSGAAKTAATEAPKAGELKAAATEVRSQDDESSIQVLRPFERPTKRVRLFRLAERVGIAAIGGAMVMGTLIYTAPTFA